MQNILKQVTNGPTQKDERVGDYVPTMVYFFVDKFQILVQLVISKALIRENWPKQIQNYDQLPQHEMKIDMFQNI